MEEYTVDTVNVLSRHYPETKRLGQRCFECWQRWPCDSARMAIELDALRAEVAEMRPIVQAVDDWDIARRDRIEAIGHADYWGREGAQDLAQASLLAQMKLRRVARERRLHKENVTGGCRSGQTALS